jgi:hypothetical protein
MALEISGKLIQLLAEQTGSGKNGTWVKQDFVVETTEQYPKKVCFNAWGDKVALLKKYPVGSTVKVSFNVESREFNGKWYTDLKIWKLDGNAQDAAPASGDAYASLTEEDPFLNRETPAESNDDLPF